ncbi:MAG: DGQHR domain-containing protein [Parvibaculales bacterium]
MKEFQFHAARVQQGDLEFYTTSVCVKDALSDGFYNVDHLDAETDKGFQRILEKVRAKKIADYILKNIGTANGVFIPTAIFAATDQPIEFDEAHSMISFDEGALPFNIVDGQHRLEGFKLAAEENKKVLDMELAFSICPEMPFLHQMCHFYIVNTTQKKVDEAIGQQIIARLTKEYQVNDTPSLPKWMDNLVKSGTVEKGVRVATELNENEQSPWKGKIIMANEPKGEGTIKQATFVKSIEKTFLSQANPVVHIYKDDFEKQCRVFLNYWIAIYEIIQPEDDSVLFKYTGAQIFNRFSIIVFDKLANQNPPSFKKETFTNLFNSLFENMSGEYAGIHTADWWRSGGVASRVNAAAHTKIINEMRSALYPSESYERIEL